MHQAEQTIQHKRAAFDTTFLSWCGESTAQNGNGNFSTNQGSNTAQILIGMDTTTSGLNTQYGSPGTGLLPFGLVRKYNLSEGRHTAHICGQQTTSGTLTIPGSSTFHNIEFSG